MWCGGQCCCAMEIIAVVGWISVLMWSCVVCWGSVLMWDGDQC